MRAENAALPRARSGSRHSKSRWKPTMSSMGNSSKIHCGRD
jgi:hypothetical protein